MGILSVEVPLPYPLVESHPALLHMDIISQEDLQPSPLVVTTLGPGKILSQEGPEFCTKQRHPPKEIIT